MMRPDKGEPGMFSTHPNVAGEATDEDEDAADYEYDADEEEEDEGDPARSRHQVCAYCGETNRLRPPRGYEFAEDEDADGEAKQIRYRCTCGEINRLRVALARESEAVRTFRESYYGRRE